MEGKSGGCVSAAHQVPAVWVLWEHGGLVLGLVALMGWEGVTARHTRVLGRGRGEYTRKGGARIQYARRSAFWPSTSSRIAGPWPAPSCLKQQQRRKMTTK